jgi:hypothetical protein
LFPNKEIIPNTLKRDFSTVLNTTISEIKDLRCILLIKLFLTSSLLDRLDGQKLISKSNFQQKRS